MTNGELRGNRGLRLANVLASILLIAAGVPRAQAPGVEVRAVGTAVRRSNPGVIEYSLESPATRLKIEIIDARKRVVRTYFNPDPDTQTATSARATEWLRALPPRTAGRHRLEWDLRHSCGIIYPGLDSLSEIRARQPWSVPGTYQARVTADEHVAETPLRVALAPDAGVSQEDLEAQLELSLRLCDQRSEALGTVFRLRQRRAWIEARPETTPPVDLVKQVAALEAALYETPDGHRAAAPLGRASWCQRIGELQREVETVDGRPSVSAYTKATELSAELEGLLRKVAALEAAAPNTFPGSPASITFDSRGVDFGPWLKQLVAQVRSHWVVPEPTPASFNGVVETTFYVTKAGAIEEVSVKTPASIEALTKAAWQAVVASNPTAPLPPKYPADRCFFTLTFYYHFSAEKRPE